MRNFTTRGLLAAALAAVLSAPLAAASARAQDGPKDNAQISPQAGTQDSAPIGPQAGTQDIAPISPQAGAQDSAQHCPGNPNALGTSRLLVIDPARYQRVGRMQYPESLPLADKEVVLTFDDGPLPPYSNQILDILASECVKATYFLVGSMAHAYPATVRRIFQEGHTIGTHSEDHPFHFGKLPIEKMRHEIDAGIADVSMALGDPQGVASFFRIPGLDRSDLLEDELAARSLTVFSSDTVADDWHHRIKANQIVDLALHRLEERGRGILLLHDIHPTTVAALPGLLKQLKDNGFHIVQVVPAAPPESAIAGKPKTWTLASAMPGQLTIDGRAAQPAWPQSTQSPAPDDIGLPAPDASTFEPDAALDVDSGTVRWPDQPAILATAPEPESSPSSRRKTAAHGRHRRESVRSAEHERSDRHAHRHARARPSADGHRADLVTEIRAVAALFTPAHPTH